MRKVCTKCNEEKNITEFYSYGTNRNKCKECARKYINARNRERAAKRPKKESVLLAESGLKKCSRCKEIKDFSFFHNNVLLKKTRTSNCKECCAMLHKLYREKQPKSPRWHLAQKNLKRCCHCKLIKPFEEFHPLAIKRKSCLSRDSRCKPCRVIAYKKYAKTPERMRKNRTWREENKEKATKYAKTYYRFHANNLTNRYLYTRIRQDTSFKFKEGEINQEILDFYRAHLTLKSIINQQRRST